MSLSVLWRIELFGGLRISGEGRVIDRFRTRKTALLLGYLAHRNGRFYSREQLIDYLWMEGDLESGQNNLRVSLSSLRRQLEPPGVPAGRVLVSDRFQVGLNFDVVQTDVQEFLQKYQSSKTLTSQWDQIDALKETVKLRQGPFLSGHYDDWVLSEEERLAGFYSSALQQLVRLLRSAGEVEEAIQYARSAIELDEFSEEAYQSLIQLYRATGQDALALRQYEHLKKSLEEGLGSKPSEATRRLMEEGGSPSVTILPPEEMALPIPPPPAAPSPALPSAGTLTFLVVDVSSSSAPARPELVMLTTELHSLVRSVFHRARVDEIMEVEGIIIGGFTRATDALACAKEMQAEMAAFIDHGEDLRGLIRMVIDTCEVGQGEGFLSGFPLSPLLALLRATNAGQFLCSERAAPLLNAKMSSDHTLRDLGLYRLREGDRFERLYQLDVRGDSKEEFPSPLPEMRSAPQLPPQFTRFVGREEEIRQLAVLLQPPSTDHRHPLGDRPRLVTLTGPGGSGKTRLSVEAAGQLVEAYGGAVWFAQLADLKDAALIPDAVLQGMRLQRSPGRDPLDQIVERLNVGASLLILDNFEHLVDEGALWVRALLEKAPQLICLVSSRQILGLAGEREYPVRPLPTPVGRESPEELAYLACIRLFVDRAQAVKPDFQLTSQNARSIAELCQRLEGIPLSIELAAARLSTLSLSQLLQQLQNRLQFLVSRKRDQIERHRSLRATIDWSFSQLKPELQQFFARLSVFRGGWGLQSATLICEEPNALDYLEQLLECSLIQRESVLPMPVCNFVRPEPDTWLVETVRNDEDEEYRFSMLETIREYGLERLKEAGEGERMRLLHLNFFRAWTEFAMWRLGGFHPGKWMRWLNAELENMRSALEWGTENEPLTALKMAGNMGGFWSLRGSWAEGLEWLNRVLSQTETEQGTPRLRALWQAGNIAIAPGEYDRAQAFLEEALALSRQLDIEGFVTATLGDLGDVATHRGEYDTAQAYYEEALQLNYEILSRQGMAQSNTALTLLRLGRIAMIRGDLERAKAHFLEGMDYFQRDGGRLGYAHIQVEYAAIYRIEGDIDEARRLLEESREAEVEGGDQAGLALTYRGMGDLSRTEGREPDALRCYTDSLVILRDLGHHKKIAEGVERIACSEGSLGHRERAARLLGAAAAMRDALGIPIQADEREEHDRLIKDLKADLTEKYEIAFDEGFVMPGDKALTYALAGANGMEREEDAEV